MDRSNLENRIDRLESMVTILIIELEKKSLVTADKIRELFEEYEPSLCKEEKMLR